VSADVLNGLDVLEELDEQRRREFRRALKISLVAHVLAGVVLAFAPHSGLRSLPPVVTIDLVSTLPSARPAPAPKPAPAPPKAQAPAAPKPPPPPPAPKKVVLPTQPEPLREKPRKPEPAKPRPKPVDYEDALAQLRDELGEETPPEPVEGEAEEPESEPAPSASEGERVPPEVAAWMRRAEIHVRRSWVTPQETIDRRLTARLRVTLSASGEVIGEPEIDRPSGDPYYDENVRRALLRASPLPPPPEPGEWPFVFSPEGVR
jgi:colicin import membrane protein